MNTQPLSLRLADIVGEQRFAELTGNNYGKEAAAELRRLYALNDDLYKQGVALIARISTLEATNQELLEALDKLARQWVGLTDKELDVIEERIYVRTLQKGKTQHEYIMKFARAIEAKLREKNGGGV